MPTLHRFYFAFTFYTFFFVPRFSSYTAVHLFAGYQTTVDRCIYTLHYTLKLRSRYIRYSQHSVDRCRSLSIVASRVVDFAFCRFYKSMHFTLSIYILYILYIEHRFSFSAVAYFIFCCIVHLLSFILFSGSFSLHRFLLLHEYTLHRYMDFLLSFCCIAFVHLFLSHSGGYLVGCRVHITSYLLSTWFFLHGSFSFLFAGSFCWIFWFFCIPFSGSFHFLSFLSFAAIVHLLLPFYLFGTSCSFLPYTFLPYTCSFSFPRTRSFIFAFSAVVPYSSASRVHVVTRTFYILHCILRTSTYLQLNFTFYTLILHSSTFTVHVYSSLHFTFYIRCRSFVAILPTRYRLHFTDFTLFTLHVRDRRSCYRYIAFCTFYIYFLLCICYILQFTHFASSHLQFT